MRIFFEDFCKDKNCEYYIEWDYEEVLHNGNREHRSTIECVSCTLVGQSYNIDKYPDECPFLEEIKQYEYEKEKERTWNKLSRK